MATAVDVNTPQGQEDFTTALVAKLKASMPGSAPPRWHGWVIAGTALVLGLTIIASLVFISRNFDVLTSVVMSNKEGKPNFAWSSMGLLGQISLRILAIYFGAAAMLAGTATAFYSIGEKITASGENKSTGLQFALATASPGIAAVVAGAVVISVAVSATIHATYGGEGQPLTTGRAEERAGTIPRSEEVLKPAPTAKKEAS